MRSSLIVFGASLSLASALAPVTGAPVFSSFLKSVLPHSRTARHLDSNTSPVQPRGVAPSLTQDTVLQSLHILPDDDNDGLLDLEGKLKVLQDGELLDLEGVVKIGNLLEGCVEVVIDGKTHKQCGRPKTQSKYKSNRDNWSKDEHRRCSKHFREWHQHHPQGSKSCGQKLEEALRRIRELEKELKSCNGDDYAAPRTGNTLATRPRPSKDDDSSNSDNDTNWTDRPQHSSHTSDESNWLPAPTHYVAHKGSPSSDDGDNGNGGCNGMLKDHVDEHGFHVQVCVSAGVSVAGVQATASASATADVDLAHGKVDAGATATAGVQVASAVSVGVKASATASVDLQKGTAKVNVDTDETLKVGDKKVIDTGVKAQVGLKKSCGSGRVLNAAGLCISLTTDDNKKEGLTGSLLSSNPLEGGRVL